MIFGERALQTKQIQNSSVIYIFIVDLLGIHESKKKYKASTQAEAEYPSVHEVTTIIIGGF